MYQMWENTQNGNTTSWKRAIFQRSVEETLPDLRRERWKRRSHGKEGRQGTWKRHDRKKKRKAPWRETLARNKKERWSVKSVLNGRNPNDREKAHFAKFTEWKHSKRGKIFAACLGDEHTYHILSQILRFSYSNFNAPIPIIANSTTIGFKYNCYNN